MRKICVATGSRAEYGILRPLMKAIQKEPGLKLQIIATNQHLSKIQGETYKEIEKERFKNENQLKAFDDKKLPGKRKLEDVTL